FERERPPIRAMALTTNTSTVTALANDYGYDLVFARQVEAWVEPGDVVIAVSTSGNSRNVIRGLEAGKRRGADPAAPTRDPPGAAHRRRRRRVRGLVRSPARGAVEKHGSHPGVPHHDRPHPVRAGGAGAVRIRAAALIDPCTEPRCSWIATACWSKTSAIFTG